MCARVLRPARVSLLICVLTLSALACSNSTPGSPRASNQPPPATQSVSTTPVLTTTPTQTTPAPTQTTPTGDRLGCGEYCLQAGGYGGGEEGQEYITIDTSKNVVAVEDTVPIKLTCLLRTPCKGAILLESVNSLTDFGRSDLLVAAKSTRTIAVEISAAGLDELRNNGGHELIEVYADYGDPDCPPGSVLPCVVTKKVTVTASAN